MRHFKILIILCASFYVASCQEIRIIKSVDETETKPSNFSSPKLDINKIFKNESEKEGFGVVKKLASTKARILNKDALEGYFSTFTTGGNSKTKLIHDLSKIGLRAARSILENYQNEAEKESKKVDFGYLEQYSAPLDYCPFEEEYNCDPAYPYRTYDGTCNNYKYPWWGKSHSPLKRLLTPAYDDYLNEPRSKSVSGAGLPNPRLIAMKIHAPRDEYSKFSNLVPHFAQFVDHDCTLTSLTSNYQGEPINCDCEDKNPDCINIKTPKEDKLNKDQDCMVTPRSGATYRKLDCKLGHREQLNMLTHYLDMSQIYGSDIEKNLGLRTLKSGFLNSTTNKINKKGYLPIDQNKKGTCANVKKGVPCFMSGEIRINQNLLLSSIHTVFLREHNRIAGLLAEQNPDWSDEKVFQETRRIIIAEYQHVVYNQWLPVLIGKRAHKLYGLMPLNQGYFLKYDQKLYPSISNEFATAAFRFGHTLIRPTMTQADVKYRKIHESALRDIVFNPSNAFKHGGIDSYIRGCVMEGTNKYDRHINDHLNNHLFEDLNDKIPTHRFSLSSLNVNRGRDHGLPGYNHYRALCGLNYANDFDDLYNIPKETRMKLKEVYAHVDDIDLFTGGIGEMSIEGGVVGPTFACIIAKQFRDLKYGDRFYYENGHEKLTRFTPMQLDEIRKVSLARILCDNVELEEIQQNPFLLPHPQTNPMMSCKDIESISMEAWKAYY